MQASKNAAIATREEWLTKLANIMRDTLFKDADAIFTDEYRVSLGWPQTRKAIGECWGPTASAAHYREIFISPQLEEATDVAATLAHELCHAALPYGVGHKAPFKKLAYAIGLVGKATATTPGGTFLKWWRDVAEEQVGVYPHSKMNRNLSRKKQTTRLIKVACPSCEDEGEPYIARMSATAIERGKPICPMHNVPMF